MKLYKRFAVIFILTASLTLLSCSSPTNSNPENDDSSENSVYSSLGKILPSDVNHWDYFGDSVCLSSDGLTAIIGAYGSSYYYGAAYIFSYDGDTWVQDEKFTASEEDWFGRSVSISGDGKTALVGAFEDDDNGAESGAAYIYTNNGGTWTQTAKLTASDGAANDYFGVSVCLSSDSSTAIICSYTENHKGAAYVFSYSGGSWVQSAKLTVSDGISSDFFGCSVDLSSDGSVALIGAESKNGIGAAYIFASSSWSDCNEIAKLTSSDGENGDYFGNSVSLSADGSTALIGAYYANEKTGSAYLFNSTSWNDCTETAKITVSGIESKDLFGKSVCLTADGTKALIGADADDDMGSAAGASYVLSSSSTSWNEYEVITKLTANDGTSGDLFGNSGSLSSDGTFALIGARTDDENGTDAGSAYGYKITY